MKKNNRDNRVVRSSTELEKLSLGRTVPYVFDYDPNLLEAIENKHHKTLAWHSFICTEFTSLCPKTGQPDFARIFIQYIPHRFLVESKSLKLYLFSFRNHGDFHEDCVQIICNDIFKKIKPHYIEVIGEFTPRGGIAIFPYSQKYSRSWTLFAKERFLNYAPGKYSVSLTKIYG